MATINANYKNLKAGYLFPEVAKRTNGFAQKNPGVKIIRLGIGNTTEPLSPAVIEGLHNSRKGDVLQLQRQAPQRGSAKVP